MNLSVKLTIDPALTRALRLLQAPQLHAAFRKALLKSMSKTLTIAAQEKIRRGGVVGKGKNRQILPPLPDMLTSRTGALRRSLGLDMGLDTSELPFAISGGSSLVYARVHEITWAGRAKIKRPFLAPALEDASKFFEQYFVDELTAAAGL